MAYGFNDDKSKVTVHPASDVYTKDEVYAKTEVYTDDEADALLAKKATYVVVNLAWTSANLSACKAAVASYRPCLARFNDGALVEFDSDPDSDVYN